jgi:hypothetical protein
MNCRSHFNPIQVPSQCSERGCPLRRDTLPLRLVLELATAAHSSLEQVRRRRATLEEAEALPSPLE